MKVLFLTLSPSPHIEGNLAALAEHPHVELVVAYETFSLGKRAWGVHLPNCEIIDLKSRKLRGMSSLFSIKLWGALKQVEPDAIVIGASMWSPNSWIARRFAVKKGVPFYIFSEAPNKTRKNLFIRLRQQIGKLFVSKASGFLGVTRGVCNEVKEQYNYSCPSLPFPYHRDLSVFAPTEELRKQDLPARLLYVGNLDDRKNVKLLISALKSVQAPFHLDILGEGELETMLKKIAAEVCPGKISFHGRVAFEAVAKYMREANFLILPSKHDGFGMVVIEALTIGLPVIASDGVRAAVEYISPGENGWIFKNGNAEDLQQKISIALANPENWVNLSRCAADITTSYNVNNTVNDFVDLAKVGQNVRGAR